MASICRIRRLTGSKISERIYRIKRRRGKDQLTFAVNCERSNQEFASRSMGSWVTYGLGAESQDLPGYSAVTAVRSLVAGDLVGGVQCTPRVRTPRSWVTTVAGEVAE
jgi:hypothetical protein